MLVPERKTLSLPFSPSISTFPSNSKNREQETIVHLPGDISNFFFFFSFEIDGGEKKVGEKRETEKLGRPASPPSRSLLRADIIIKELGLINDSQFPEIMWRLTLLVKATLGMVLEREFSERDFTRAVENNGFVTAVLLLISDNNGKPEQKIWRNERGIGRKRKEEETDGEGWRRWFSIMHREGG